MTRPPLNKKTFLAFKFPALVKRLEKELKLSREDAETLFVDMLKYLYLAGTSKRSFSPPPLIDEAWHTFIIFTQDYAKFCNENFGRFIHHVPFTDDHKPSEEGAPIRPFAYRAFGKLSKFWPKESVDGCEDCAPVACGHR